MTDSTSPAKNGRVVARPPAVTSTQEQKELLALMQRPAVPDHRRPLMLTMQAQLEPQVVAAIANKKRSAPHLLSVPAKTARKASPVGSRNMQAATAARASPRIHA